MISRMARRRLLSRLMTGLTVLAALIALLPLFAIFADLLVRGASSINLAFFIENPPAPGASGGGVANAIVGTLIIVGVGSAIGLPIGIGGGVYLAEYGGGRLGFVTRFLADVLNGTPSVIVGIFVWTWVVRPMGHFSALSGSIALAVLMIPRRWYGWCRTRCARPRSRSATRAGARRSRSWSAPRGRAS
jgi:phosphate transport system permease protein